MGALFPEVFKFKNFRFCISFYFFAKSLSVKGSVKHRFLDSLFKLPANIIPGNTPVNQRAIFLQQHFFTRIITAF